jgi:dTDP-4-amino-4,6-dideoxygalactose transaminase
MKRPILISIAPNIEKDDIGNALKMLFKPFQWYNFRYTEKLEKDFAGRFGDGYKALAVNSGRTAMFLILKALGITFGDEVCLQAFTCSAAVNPIKWNGAKPVFLDIDGSYNLNPDEMEKKITRNTKAVIIQHTFGIPASLDKILRIAKRKKVKVIEDCAVSLGATYKGKQVGQFGDAAFFSFGRDKIVSGTFGGMMLTKDKKLFTELEKLRDSLSYPSPGWTIQQLLNPILSPAIKKTYFFGIGKVTVGKMILWISQKMRFLGKAISYEETFGSLPVNLYPRKISGAISFIISKQLEKLDRFNSHRKKIADIYFEELSEYTNCLPPRKHGSIWLRFPVVVERKNEILNNFKKAGILVGDWYKTVIYPVSALHHFNYSEKTCPTAEIAAKTVINLPTMPTMTADEAREVALILKKWLIK